VSDCFFFFETYLYSDAVLVFSLFRVPHYN